MALAAHIAPLSRIGQRHNIRVHSTIMSKNITLTADEAIIQQARRRAVDENTTLNELFRGWLKQYVQQPAASDRFTDVMEQLQHIQAGRSFTREEMNERR